MKPYSESPPPLSLSSTIECFWSHQSGADSVAHRVLPDGCLDLLVMAENGKLHGYIIGAMTSYKDVVSPPHTFTAGIRFLPGQAGRHLNLPLQELRDQRVDLEAVFGKHAARWMDAAAHTTQSGTSTMWQETLTLLGAARDASPAQQAAEWAVQNHVFHLEAIRQSVWMSERQFRRLFMREAGIGAKQYLRVMRVRRALAALRRNVPHNLAQFASEYGFYDQAHCANEFRELTGKSPTKWLRDPE